MDKKPELNIVFIPGPNFDQVKKDAQIYANKLIRKKLDEQYSKGGEHAQ